MMTQTWVVSVCASFIILQFSSLYFFLLRRCSFSERNLHSFSPHFRVLIVDLLFCIVRLSLFGRFIAEKNVKFHLYEERVNAALCHSVSFFFIFLSPQFLRFFSPVFGMCRHIFCTWVSYRKRSEKKMFQKQKNIWDCVCTSGRHGTICNLIKNYFSSCSSCSKCFVFSIVLRFSFRLFSFDLSLSPCIWVLLHTLFGITTTALCRIHINV